MNAVGLRFQFTVAVKIVQIFGNGIFNGQTEITMQTDLVHLVQVRTNCITCSQVLSARKRVRKSDTCPPRFQKREYWSIKDRHEEAITLRENAILKTVAGKH